MDSWVGLATALATGTTNRTTVNMLRLKRQPKAQFPLQPPIKTAMETDTAMVMATAPAGQDKHPATFSILFSVFLFISE